MPSAPENHGPRTYNAGEAITEYLRVKLSGTDVVKAGAGEEWIGTTLDQVASGSPVAVEPSTTPGTRKMVASAAVTAGDALYGAAGGKVSGTVVGRKIGTALQAASGDGSIIEVALANNLGTGHALTIEAKTGNYTVTAADSGKVFTNTGAGGTITFTLPVAVVGLHYIFSVGAAQALRIDPNGTETIALPSTGVPAAAGKYIVASAEAGTVTVVCTKAGGWAVSGYTGTWTAEP